MSYILNDYIIIDASSNLTLNNTVAQASLDLSSRTDAIIVPVGNTSQRPVANNIIRFNSQLNVIEFKFINEWFGLSQVPYIDSVSPSVLESVNDTVTVIGRNFSSNAVWTFISKTNKTYVPKDTSYNSVTSVTLRRPDVFPVSDAPYIIKVKQFNRYNTYEHVTAGVIPTFSIAGGSLGVFDETIAITNINITVSDEAGGSISSVTITSGSLPSGLSGSFTPAGTGGTYTISGTPSVVQATTVYNFRLTATDSGGNTNAIDYSITINKLLYTYDISGSVGIYSLRVVAGTYSGPVIRLRKSSDNTESDFYITTDGSLNTLANGTGSYINTWLGGSTGFVNTWYDQSGKGNHMIETTAGNQPIYMPTTRSVMFNTSRLRAYFSSQLNFSTFTMVGYVNFNYGSAAGYFGVESFDGNTFDTLVKNESTYQLLQGSNNFARTYGNTTIPVNGKHSAVMMFTTSNQRIWIDNNKDYASNTTFSPFSYQGTGSSTNGPHFNLGYRHANGVTGPLINSEMYEIAYFNSYLGDTQIRAINENLLSTYSPGYLLNSMTTTTKNSVIVAYSLRRVNPSYAGPVVRVRRSTDSSESDFYSTYYGLLTLDPSGNGTTLLSWLTGATGYVRTWYDQSGTERHAIQTTTGSQPQISFTLGYPTVYFNSATNTTAIFMNIGSLTLTAPFTFIFLSRKTRDGRWISQSNTSPNSIVGYWGNYESSFYMDNNPGNPSGYPDVLGSYPQNLNSDYIHTVGKSTNMLDYYLMNGYIRHYNVPGSATNFGNSIILGGGYSNAEYGAGYFSELLIHNIVVPTYELDTIHKNIGSYYNIKVASTPGYLSFPDMSSATQVGSTTAWTLTVSGQVYEVSANSQYDNSLEPTKKAFDKNSNVIYTTANLYPATTFTEWVRMKFPVAVYPKILRITGVTNSANQRNIKDALIQASTNDTNWTTLLTIPTQDAWANFAVRNFFIPQTSTAYQYYRLYITTKQGQVVNFDFISIAELDLLHTLTPSIEIPYSISGLTLYLDAHMHNSGTTTWIDRSGNGYHFTIASAAFSNTTTVSFMNFESNVAKRIVGGALTDVPAFANATFIVFGTILNSTANWRTLIRAANNATGDHQIIINTGANTLGMFDNGVAAFQSAGFDVSTIPNYTTVYNMYVWKLSSSSPYYQFRYNTKPVWYTITNANATFNTGFACIGGYHGNSTVIGTASQYWGKIALVLYYNKHLTDAEINSIYEFYKPRFPIG